MPSLAADLARRVAQRLGSLLDPHLPAAVEARLQGGKPPERFGPSMGTTNVLASFVIGAAELACNVGLQAVPDVLARRLRLGLDAVESVLAHQRDRIISTIVEEVLQTQVSSFVVPSALISGATPTPPTNDAPPARYLVTRAPQIVRLHDDIERRATLTFRKASPPTLPPNASCCRRRSAAGSTSGNHSIPSRSRPPRSFERAQENCPTNAESSTWRQRTASIGKRTSSGALWRRCWAESHRPAPGRSLTPPFAGSSAFAAMCRD